MEHSIYYIIGFLRTFDEIAEEEIGFYLVVTSLPLISFCTHNSLVFFPWRNHFFVCSIVVGYSSTMMLSVIL